MYYEKNGAPLRLIPPCFMITICCYLGKVVLHIMYTSVVFQLTGYFMLSLSLSVAQNTLKQIWKFIVWKFENYVLLVCHILKLYIRWKNLFDLKIYFVFWNFSKIYLICEFENLFRKFMLFQNYLHKVSKFRQKCLKHHLT